MSCHIVKLLSIQARLELKALGEAMRNWLNEKSR